MTIRHREGLTVSLYGSDVCKIVGKRIEKRMVQRPSVPVEMVEVEESIEIPVTNCDLENGNVKKEEVIFAEAV